MADTVPLSTRGSGSPGRPEAGPATGAPVCMTFDREAAASYIRLAAGAFDDSWPLDQNAVPFDIVVDLDATQKVLGVELLGRPGEGPTPFLEAIANGTLGDVLAAEGFEVPELRGGPQIAVDIL